MPRLIVVKLGGSLFDLVPLVETLERWLARDPAAAHLFVAGGGAVVDAIEAFAARHGVTDRAAHYACIRAMQIQAELLRSLWPRLAAIDHLSAARELPPGSATIYDAWQLVTRDDPLSGGPTLPESWEVTSDSIAARLAELTQAAELVLLKSRLPEGEWDRDAASAAGYVDRYFAMAAKRVPLVRCVDLRSAEFMERRLD